MAVGINSSGTTWGWEGMCRKEGICRKEGRFFGGKGRKGGRERLVGGGGLEREIQEEGERREEGLGK